jgi:molecular chaperone HscB
MMNYFDLFEIPVQLKIDKAVLHKKFIELSKKYHPDYFANATAEVQADVLERSALLNKALKTLQQPDETIKYVLIQKGLLQEEEKYELPPDFLMEMMDINEQLMDADNAAVVHTLRTAIDTLQTEIYAPVETIITDYEEGTTTEEELLQVKAYYYKKKYLARIRQQLVGKA